MTKSHFDATPIIYASKWFKNVSYIYAETLRHIRTFTQPPLTALLQNSPPGTQTRWLPKQNNEDANKFYVNIVEHKIKTNCCIYVNSLQHIATNSYNIYILEDAVNMGILVVFHAAQVLVVLLLLFYYIGIIENVITVIITYCTLIPISWFLAHYMDNGLSHQYWWPIQFRILRSG